MELLDLKGISYQRKKLLERINIFKINDLITFFPKKYKDLSIIKNLEDTVFSEDEEFMVRAKIIEIEKLISAKKKPYLKIKIQDETANAYLLAFNQNYLKETLKINETYTIIGKFVFEYGMIQSTAFQIENLNSESIHYGRIVPYYALTEGLSQKILRNTVSEALTLLLPKIHENLPSSIIKKRYLMGRTEALQNIHFPENFDNLAKAQKRLKYYEFFKIQIQLAFKKNLYSQHKKHRYKIQSSLLPEFLKSLPFQLTEGQKKAFEEIQNDLYSEKPMHRLLQGDVGAGKTMAALLCALLSFESGFQTAFIVPTEVLAYQHYKKISALFSPFGIKTALLTGSIKGKERNEVYQGLEDGQIHLVVGTHAIFSETVQYRALSLLIIDEQHKFGVMQRAKAVSKGDNPDILVMSATPIPRTLGITLFGDMDFSIIPDKPGNRQNIKTYWVKEDKLKKVFDFAEKEIEKGNQGFVVYPLIDDSEKVDLKSATAMFEEIKQKYLPGRRLALLHGRIGDDEKKEAMDLFLNKKIDVLISTTVIEVGVDVADATFIIIENAYRFGLSTLHQLRGRVGRSAKESFCFLITPSDLNPESQERMKAMTELDDGFVLAQKDLEIRGAGEFLGTSQKGFKGLQIASLIHDRDLLESARKDAFELVAKDPGLEKPENQILKKAFEEFKKKYEALLKT